MLPVLRMLDTIMAESGGVKNDTEEGYVERKENARLTP